MHKHNILWNLPGYIDMPAWERYYRRYHGPEIVARLAVVNPLRHYSAPCPHHLRLRPSAIKTTVLLRGGGIVHLAGLMTVWSSQSREV